MKRKKILHSIIEGKKVIIFGCSSGGKQLANLIDNNFEYYIDNDTKKKGEIINDKVVNSPDHIEFEDKNSILILIASEYTQEITQQLLGYGLEYYIHFIYALDFVGSRSENILKTIKDYINQKPHLLDGYSNCKLFEQIQSDYVPIKSASMSQKHFIRHEIPIVLQNAIRSYDTQLLLRGFDYLIHGSQADNTATPFSDIDDLIILKKDFFTCFEVFEATISALHKLNLFYQQYDITQHHGHWIVSYDELYSYDEAYMPSIIFEDSVSVFGHTEIDVFTREYSSFSNQLSLTCDFLEKKVNELFNNRINLYGLKHLVSGVALLFPLYFQNNGKMISKKNAILEAEYYFDKDIIDILRWVSLMRKKWDKVPTYETVEQYKSKYSPIRNSVLIESAVSLTAPMITPRELEISNPEYFKDKILNAISFFRVS